MPRHLHHKFDPERMAHLESEERRAVLDPAKVLPFFEIGKGWTVVDVGCGPGFFTFPLASIVGTAGQVYGVDMEQLMIRRLEERIAEKKTRNVVAVVSTENSIPLQDASADFVLLSTVLHELEGSGTLSEIRRLLKANGTLGVVDWKKLDEPHGPPKAHRLSEDKAAKILRKAGFDPGRPINVTPSHYGFRAHKV